MPNYGAWGALATGGDSLMDAYMASKAMRQKQDADKANKANAEELRKSEIAKNIYQAGGPAYESPTASMPSMPSNDFVMPPESDMPLPGEQPKSQLPLLPQVGDRSNRTTGVLEQGNPDLYMDKKPSGINPLPVSSPSPNMGEAPPRLPGQSAKDYSKFLNDWGLQGHKASLAPGIGGNGGIPRGLATILSKSGLTMQESNKIDAMASAIPIHNEITDAIIAYGNNDPSVAKATVDKYIARHPDVSGFFQTYKANPHNQAAMYDALTRLGSIEQFKLSNGSQSAPTEDAIRANQGMYPTLQEIAAKSPNVAGKMNALYENTISPAYTGPITRMGLMKGPNGKLPVPVLDNIYSNLNSGYEQLGNKIKMLPGYSAKGGMMQIPAERSGMGAGKAVDLNGINFGLTQ